MRVWLADSIYLARVRWTWNMRAWELDGKMRCLRHEILASNTLLRHRMGHPILGLPLSRLTDWR